MPHGRMQHTAPLPWGKSCSAYAVNLFASTLKNNFLLSIFRVTKTVKLMLKKTTIELSLIFYLTGCCNSETPYSHDLVKIMSTLQSMANIRWQTLWDRHFADQIFMPHGMQRPSLSHTALTSTLFLLFAACRAAWPSVDSP